MPVTLTFQPGILRFLIMKELRFNECFLCIIAIRRVISQVVAVNLQNSTLDSLVNVLKIN